MAPLTILITGGTSGFGLAFTLHALFKGHKVLATARNISRAQSSRPEVEAAGGIWLPLDVTSANVRETVSDAVAKDDVDVVINNAGYAHCVLVEDASSEEVEAQFKTNVFGPIQVIRGALLHFRARKRGIIVNVSSTISCLPEAGAALYSASKGAVDALTEALAAEVAPFGIKVLNVTPGAFRTGFLASDRAVVGRYDEAYRGTPGAETIDVLPSVDGKQPGDPRKGVERMLEFIVGEGLGGKAMECGRLFIGSDAKEAVENAVGRLQTAWIASEEAAMGCDVEEEG